MSEKSKKSLFATASERYSDVANAATWSEWRDSDLNSERWEVPRNGPDGLFLDTEHVAMPRSLTPHKWIRARDLKQLTAPLTVYTMTTGYPDLITNNKYLLHSEFVRWFISALRNLQYCGRDGLEISGEGTNFFWANRHRPWYGWMHVYSLNKAGNGAQHRPVVNPNGKYIVRLHCMGCWRRILVDDTVPVGKGGRLLLPRTSDNFELWPMLLAKALLKVAALSWTARREIIDFHPITCFTGWTCLTLNIAHLSSRDKWEFLTKYTEQFEWPSRIANGGVSENSKNVTSDKAEKSRKTSQLRVGTEGTQRPTVLFLFVRDTRELGSDAVPGLSPCWDHMIHAAESRHVPMKPEDVKPPLAKWKLHRWLSWAISENLVDPADYFVPIRYLRVVSPLERCDDSRVYDEIDTEEDLTVTPAEVERPDGPVRKERAETRPRNTTELSIATEEEEDVPTDISQWIDFNKLAPCVTEMHLFYKPEYFQCSVRVTSGVPKTTSENHKATITKGPKREKADLDPRPSVIGKFPMSTYHWPRKILQSRNEPLYLLCDSTEKKFFLVNLCSAPRLADNGDYLILERHNWFYRPDRSDGLIAISTSGVKAAVLELEAGRQLLRIYCRSASSSVIVSSDTDFHLGNRSAVQKLMTTESESIEQISSAISRALCGAYRSFGSGDYPAMLREYYRSYMPDFQTAPLPRDEALIRLLIHRIFMEEQVRLIGKVFKDDELRTVLYSLRVFFLDPNVRLEYLDSVTAKEDPRDPTKDVTSDPRVSTDRQDRAATTLQSFFKMALVNKYKQLHNPEHALHAEIRKELIKITDLIDPSVTGQWLRNAIGRHDDLRDLYPCAKDFRHVLQLREFRGVSENLKQSQWFPIARFAVNPGTTEATVLAAIELLIDLPRFALRVFDNESGREVTRLASQVLPDRYGYVPAGCTVFAYGWSEKRAKELEWWIRVITMKGEPMLHQLDEQRVLSAVDTRPPKLTIDELCGTYLPNARNCISRWSLRVTTRSVVSIRLITSYDLVEVKLKLTDEAGNVLADVDGGSTILLPLVILDGTVVRVEDDRSRGSENGVGQELETGKGVYYVEAFVLDNSWPLTVVEWRAVQRAKTSNMKNLQAKAPSGSVNSSRSNLPTARRGSRQSANDNQSLESPYWILQVLTDARDAVEVCRDNSREQEIALLKESWCSNDPDRSVRGGELRETFLNKHALGTDPDTVPGQNDDDERSENIPETEDATFRLSREEQHRSLQSPELLPYPQPLLSLSVTKHAQKDEDMGCRWVKTDSNEEISRKQRADNAVDAQRDYSNFLIDLAELTNRQARRYTKLFRKTEENFRKRGASLDAAYESRKIYIDNLAAEGAKTDKKKRKKD